MKEKIGLSFELFMIILIPTIIPICMIIIAGILKYNQKVKKVIMLLLSIIYNVIIGIMSPFLFFLLLIFTEAKILFVPTLIFVFAIILIPLNTFVVKKGKFNIGIYVLIHIASLLLSSLTLGLSLLKVT